MKKIKRKTSLLEVDTGLSSYSGAPHLWGHDDPPPACRRALPSMHTLDAVACYERLDRNLYDACCFQRLPTINRIEPLVAQLRVVQAWVLRWLFGAFFEFV